MKFEPLDALCTIRHGGTPSKANPAFWQGDIPWISPKDMKASLIEDATDHISAEAIKNSATRLVPEKTILMVVRSGILAHSFPVAQVGRPVAFNQDIKALMPDARMVDPDYLFWFLRSQEPRVLRQGVKKGATVHSLQSGFIESLQVPVPATSEQRRIVDALSRAEGIARLRREAQQKAAELIPAIFLNMFGNTTENSDRWPTKPLGELCSFLSGGTPAKSRPDFWSGNLPWVSPKDMKKVRLNDAIDHVSEKVLTETNLKLVPVGAVLIVVRGMILAHTVPIAIADKPLTINQDMKAILPCSDVDSVYLLWALRVSHHRLIGLVSTAAHGTKKIDMERIEAIRVPLPPIETQRLFASLVSKLEGIQESQLAATRTAEATFAALLARAFDNKAV